MTLIELIKAKREHLERLANQTGAEGEIKFQKNASNVFPRPKGKAMKNLLRVLAENGIVITPRSFDFVIVDSDQPVDWAQVDQLRLAFPKMIFVEVKTTNRAEVSGDFSKFFFALTENEIHAAEALGNKHRVVLVNKSTDEMYVTTVSDIIRRSKSTTWQVSVHL